MCVRGSVRGRGVRSLVWKGVCAYASIGKCAWKSVQGRVYMLMSLQEGEGVRECVCERVNKGMHICVTESCEGVCVCEAV